MQNCDVSRVEADFFPAGSLSLDPDQLVLIAECLVQALDDHGWLPQHLSRLSGVAPQKISAFRKRGGISAANLFALVAALPPEIQMTFGIHLMGSLGLLEPMLETANSLPAPRHWSSEHGRLIQTQRIRMHTGLFRLWLAFNFGDRDGTVEAIDAQQGLINIDGNRYCIPDEVYSDQPSSPVCPSIL